MYDTVVLRCSSYGEEHWAQSKGGECILGQYELNKALVDVLSEVNRYAPFECEKCGCMFEVELKVLAIERKV